MDNIQRRVHTILEAATPSRRPPAHRRPRAREQAARTRGGFKRALFMVAALCAILEAVAVVVLLSRQQEVLAGAEAPSAMPHEPRDSVAGRPPRLFEYRADSAGDEPQIKLRF